MPARLYFSNSLEILADRLIENMARENLAQAGGDPFRAPALATPSSSLRDWLKIQIAEKMKIAANIAFPHLENLLWDRLAERDALRVVEDRQPARLLDTFSFQGLVLAQLRRNPPLALREYLRSEDPADAARRLIQIAGRLASLFREYEYSRVSEYGYPGVADSWNRGETSFGKTLLRGSKLHPAGAYAEEVRDLEAWQMEVYREIFREDDGIRDQWGRASGVYRYTLPQYARKALEHSVIPPAENRATFHLFGLANISPFHRDLIGRLADETRLGEGAATFEIYALNPCAEYWEDALTPRERKSSRFENTARPIARERILHAGLNESEILNAEIGDAPDENGLLALLGKPGRETVKLWCQLTEYDFHEDFREPKGPGLLAKIQKSILSRLPSLSDEDRVPQDDSLRIRSAPDARAEIELARAEAAEMLRDDPDLRPEDLAIIPADPESILPAMRAAFAGGAGTPGNVPVLLPGGGGNGDAPILAALRALLSPGLVDADRHAVMALLEHPAVLRKLNIEPGRIRTIRGFLEAAGFQEGWGKNWNSEEHDGDDTGGSTASDAEMRGVLALALDPSDTNLEAAGFWPAREAVGLLDREEIAALLEWLDALREGLRPFRENTLLSFVEWGQRLRALMDTFLEADAGDAADVRAEIDLRRFCAELEQWNDWSQGTVKAELETAAGDSDLVSGILIILLFEDRFREPNQDRAAFLRGGIRVDSLSALRGIPFRHVWVTGLAANVFPAPGQSTPLDLRAYRRMPGESDRTARDLYALLEVIASTTDSLTLSWPRRDAARNAEHPASRALTGLAGWLESDILQGSAPFAVSKAARLTRFEGRHPPLKDPAPIPWAEEPELGGRFEKALTDWNDLAAYLRNPAEHAALRHFKLRAYEALDFGEEERAAALFLSRRDESDFMDAALRAELLKEGSGMEAFERAWIPRAHGGRVPPPPFGNVEEARLRSEVSAIAKNAAILRRHLERVGLAFAGTLRVGPQGPATGRPPLLSIPAFEPSGLNVPVRLGGILPWFFSGNGAGSGWGLLVEKDKEFPAYLLHLCIAALGAPPLLDGAAHLFVRDKKNDRIKPFALPQLDPETARKSLRDLLEDFSKAPDFRDLPVDVIEKIRRDAMKQGRTVTDWEEEINSRRHEDEENPFTRTPFATKVLRVLRTGTPKNAEQDILRRVLPYLEWKAAWIPAGKNEAAGAEAGEDV